MRHARRGASALEFALTLPILLIIVSAIAAYGWFLAQQTQVLQAVGDGARLAATVARDAATGPEDAAVEHTRTVLTGMGIPCSAGEDCELEAEITSSGSLDVITVRASIGYSPVTGLVPNPERIYAETAMALEDQ